MIVAFEVPIYVPLHNEYLSPLSFPVESILPNGESVLLLGAVSPAHAADLGVAKLIAIGAILGGGVTALLKMLPTFKTVTADLRKSRGSGGGMENTAVGIKRDWVPGKGWYEWPLSHIKVMMIITAVGISLIFSLGGFPVIPSIIFALVLVGLTFILGSIAIKVGGEVGTTPVSGTSFLCLLFLVLIFWGINILFHPFEGTSQLVIME